MEKHAGQAEEPVRPVVVEPQVGAARPRLARNARHMPTGVSANTLGLGDGSVSRVRRILFVGVPLTALLVILLGTLLVMQSVSPFGAKTLSNGAYQYTFRFYKTAEPVNLVQGEGLRYGDKALAIAEPTTDNVPNDCTKVGAGWQNAFNASVEGKIRPVCVRDNKAFLVTFYHNDSRHLFEITYTSAPKNAANDVRVFVESMRVSLD